MNAYIPGEMAREYDRLPPATRSEINARVDELYARRNGVFRRFDPSDPADLPGIREWLQLRDQVMAERLGHRGPIALQLSPRIQSRMPEAREAMKDLGEESFQEFEETVAKYPSLFESIFDLLDAGAKFYLIGRMWANMRHWGCSSYDILRGIEVLMNEGRGEPQIIRKIVEVFARPSANLTTFLRYASVAGITAAIFNGLIASLIGMRRGDYHLVAVHAYRIGMQQAIRWTALIGVFQETTRAIWPGLEQHEVFTFLIAANPINLGGIAVDSFGVFIHSCVQHQVDIRRLDRLVERMRDAGATGFVEMGDRLGDALFELTKLSEREFTEALAPATFVNWVRSFQN